MAAPSEQLDAQLAAIIIGAGLSGLVRPSPSSNSVGASSQACARAASRATAAPSSGRAVGSVAADRRKRPLQLISEYRPTSRYDGGVSVPQPVPATRLSIINAGCEVAKQHGVLGLSVDNVLALAGVSKGGVFHYFPTKQALIVAVVESELDRFDAAIQARLSKGASFPEAAVETLLDFLKSNATMMASVNAALAFGEELRGIVERRRAAWLLGIRGSIESDARADLLAIAIDGVIFSCSTRNEPFSKPELGRIRQALSFAMGKLR